MVNNLIIPIVLSCTMAYFAVRWIYFKILKVAIEKNLVDNPEGRKMQKQPVPVVGGLAVFLGVLTGIMTATAYHHTFCPETESTNLLPIICSMSVMIYIGALDDILGLTPMARFAIEIASIVALVFGTGICIDTFHGLWGIENIAWWVAVPLTVFAGVGIINSINMIDGVNGLSSGLCMTCCIVFGAAFVIANDMANAILAFTMAVALLPFFLRNVFGMKSRMFIGDAGTMVMGIMITWFVMSMLSKNSLVAYNSSSHNVNLIAFSLAVLSVPIFDTLRVMSMRMANGGSPFMPDKTHLHHVFVNVGISHIITSISEILIGLLIVAIWYASFLLGSSFEVQLYVVIASSMILVWGTFAFLRYHAKNHTEFLHWLSHTSERTQLGRKDWWKSYSQWLDRPINYAYTDSADDPKLAKSAVARDKFNPYQPAKRQVLTIDVSRNLVMTYIKGKAEVHVKDLIAYSGAEEKHVSVIIREESKSGRIRVLKLNDNGDPAIIASFDCY